VATFEQVDWGGGIYRGRRAPQGTVYDALNALVDDEGQLFARGKTTYKSNANAGSTLRRIATATLAGPDEDRVLAWGTKLYTLNGSAPVQVFDAGSHVLGRPVGVGGAVVFPYTSATVPPYPPFNQVLVYGGSLLSADVVSEGTITVTAGSMTVTKSGGASWVGVVDPGMIIAMAAGYGLVRSVDSANQITLSSPWTGTTSTTGTYEIKTYVVTAVGSTLPTGIPATDPIYLGSAANRLLVAVGNRVYICPPGFPFLFDQNVYLELSAATRITGILGAADTALLFSTSGAWAVTNLFFDAVDDAGNIQWQQEQVNGDVLLWGELGMVSSAFGLIVPALDDVYLMTPSGEARAISEAIRPLYRSYVKAGYQPGSATMHRGHYILPIVSGATVVDELVCRIDRPFGEGGLRPWTRWAGHAAGPGVGALPAPEGPKLLGVNGERVTDLTGCMDVLSGSGQDANSTTPTFRVDSNDDDLGPGIRPNTAEKVRYVYETTGGTPTVDVKYATGPEGSSYAAATLKRGGGASDGTDYSAWKLTKSAERIRFRFECTSQVTSLVLRRREVFVRPAAQS
jgi:hypothetical protein